MVLFRFVGKKAEEGASCSDPHQINHLDRKHRCHQVHLNRTMGNGEICKYSFYTILREEIFMEI